MNTASFIPGEPTLISGDRRRTHAELRLRADRAATGLRALGAGEDDVVALFLRNDFAFFEATLAAGRIGAYATPLNWHATAAEARYVLEDSGAKVLVVHDHFWPRLRGAVPTGVQVLVVPTPTEILAAYGEGPAAPDEIAGLPRWDDWLAGFAPDETEPAALRGAMIYTSGTTGAPKGVRRFALAGEALARMHAHSALGYGITPQPGMVVLMNGPMYHSAPNAYGMGALRAGADIVLQARFDAEQMLAMIAQYGVTHMHIVPTMFHRLLALPEAVRRRYDLTSLRDVVHGAAPCPVTLKRAMIDWWGPVISEYYGSTETGLITRSVSADFLARPGTVGRALPSASLRVYDEAGQVLGPGEIGDLYVRVETMPGFTYHRNPAKRESVGRDGFVTVGDIGRVDADGYVFLCDRRNDMIISGGVNIYPAEIEAAVLAVPGVRDCAVFGIPDEEYGEAVCCHVERMPDAVGAALDAASLRRALAVPLAKFKIPRVIVFADTLPREDSGKIFKRRLKAPYWEQRAADPSAGTAGKPA